MTGFGLLDGEVVGIVANQPAVKGGVLFVDSADKGARFIWQCDAFNVPLLYLADVPGFMIGSAVERQGIIRHGAKMITAVAEATVPTISVIVRKAYGAGLYAMAGPGFGPDACLALPTAKIAVMGPEAAINAVYANKIAEIADEAERTAYVARLRQEYEIDIDILRLASELIIDAIVEPADLRRELIARFAAAADQGPALLHSPARRSAGLVRPERDQARLKSEWAACSHDHHPAHEGPAHTARAVPHRRGPARPHRDVRDALRLPARSGQPRICRRQHTARGHGDLEWPAGAVAAVR